jgi:hypothetical protein
MSKVAMIRAGEIAERDWIASSIVSSAAGVNPYPDLTSIVVAPDAIRQSIRGFASERRAS